MQAPTSRNVTTSRIHFVQALTSRNVTSKRWQVVLGDEHLQLLLKLQLSLHHPGGI
jgi:hypothetical protein